MKLKRRVLSVVIFSVFILLGLFLGTQRIASGLSYDDALGLPVCSLFGMRLYLPWKMITWSMLLKGGGESLRVAAFQWFLGTSAGGFLVLMGLMAFRNEDEIKEEEIFGNSSFANSSEIRKQGLLSGKGVFLGVLRDGRYLRHDGPEHYCVIAPTRSGKGAGIVIPTLLSWPGSTIIYDLKEENYRVSARQRSKFSDIIYFNPKSVHSAHFNPLLEVRQGPEEIRDVQNIANMIIEPETPGVADHWIRTGNSLLVAAILHVLYTSPNEEKNLAGVTTFLSRPNQSLSETLLEMIETPHLPARNGLPGRPHPHIQEAARDVLNKSPDDRSSVHSTVMGYLSLYRDPLLAHNTRDSDFRIVDLVSEERPKSLYLVIPPADILRLRPIIRLIINQICRRLTEELPGEAELKRTHKLLLLMDEFPALGRLEFFESALSFLAGYGIKTMLIAQSMNQLRATYGERNSILDNTKVKVVYAPETVETAEYISKTLGQTTVRFRTEGESGQKGTPFFTGKSASTHFSARALMTPREVLDMSQKDALIFIGGAKPIRCEKIRYFEDGTFTPLLGPPLEPSRSMIEGSEGRKRAMEAVWLTQFGDLREGEEDSESLFEKEEGVIEIEPVDEPESEANKVEDDSAFEDDLV